MTRTDLFENASKSNFELVSEKKDNRGITFLLFVNGEKGFIYRDQIDDDFFLVGIYRIEMAKRLIDKFTRKF